MLDEEEVPTIEAEVLKIESYALENYKKFIPGDSPVDLKFPSFDDKMNSDYNFGIYIHINLHFQEKLFKVSLRITIFYDYNKYLCIIDTYYSRINVMRVPIIQLIFYV